MRYQIIGLIVVIIGLGVINYSGILAAILTISGLCFVVKGKRNINTTC